MRENKDLTGLLFSQKLRCSSLFSIVSASRAVVGASQSGTANLIPCLLDEPLSDASSLNIVVEGQEAYDNQATIQALQTRNQKRSSLHHRPSKTR